MRVRFLHSSDWQLGVTRHFLDADSQARWAAARFDAIRKLGQIAVREKCEFIVVAGDIFESNQVNRGTVAKACEAMSGFSIPIFLLPANHDPFPRSPIRFQVVFLLGRRRTSCGGGMAAVSSGQSGELTLIPMTL